MTRAGDNIVAVSTLYGGTYNLFAHTLPQYGIEVRFVDPDRPDDLARYVDDKTRLVFVETIGNPRLNVIDIRAWADAAHAAGLPLIVDNTVPTPIGCPVFELGADVAVHSLTKYIGGHGTSIGGAIVDNGSFDWAAQPDRYPGLAKPDPSYHGVVWTDALGPSAYIGRVRTVLLRNTGAAISPFNAFLFLQGVETLPLRMERHNQNAQTVAEHLAQHPQVRWVNYPGLEDDPYHEVAQPHAPRRLRRARHVRHRRRPRGGTHVHREPRTVLAPREHRRCEVARDPSGDDDALAAERGGARRSRASRPTRCGSPSASSTSTTSSATSTRRSRRPAWQSPA